jgi:hypothetical protein
MTGGFVALVNFQFSSEGGKFCVNLGYADPQRNNVFYEPDTDVKKRAVSQTRGNVRLGATQGGDCWFSFGATRYAAFRGQPLSVEELVSACRELLAAEAESWWRSKQPSNA